MGSDDFSSAARQAPEAVYERYIAETFSREKSNVENYDRSLLTLSAALLGLSATFIREIAPPGEAVHLWALYASWVALALTIIATIGCYLFGQWTFKASLRDGKLAIIGRDAAAFARLQAQGNRTRAFTFVAGICFIVGFGASVSFVAINVHEESTVANKNAADLPGIARRGLTAPPIEAFVTTPEPAPTPPDPQPAPSTEPSAPAAE